MTKEEILARLADLEERRTDYLESAEALLFERDQLIYDALTPKPPLAPTAAVAAIIGSDRSWPYTIRDTFQERLRRYREKRAADELTRLGQDTP